MNTSNPTLTLDTFRGLRSTGSDSMTVQGVVFKTVICLLCVLLTAGWMWMKFYKAGANPAVLYPWMVASAIAGFIIALATVFKKEWSPITAPMYALVEGVFVGGISSVMEVAYPGVVAQAVCLTFGTLFAMLFAYQSGLIRATESFKLGVVAATGGIALVYIVTMVLSFFGIHVPFIYGSGVFGILFSLFVVVVAALNFVIDFDFIEQGAKAGAPKYMEWYGSFALMVTLIWLYIEFLRLLTKIRDR